MVEPHSNPPTPSLPPPLILPLASPSQLLSYLISRHSYPLTLVIASSRQDFLTSLAFSVETSQFQNPETRHPLLAASLFQTAIATHIRVVFTPTVSHLRAWLSVFDPRDSTVAAPPGYDGTPRGESPWLVVYGMVQIHRGSSEWSGQGVMSTLATFIEAGARTGYRPAVIEPSVPPTSITVKTEGAPTDEPIVAEDGPDMTDSWQTLASQHIPLLGYKQSSDIRLSKRTIPISRIFLRWFQYHHTIWTADAEAPATDSPDFASQEEAAMSQADDMMMNRHV